MSVVLPINLAVEFHDSEVASVLQDESELRVTFSAAVVHGSSGIPGSENGIIVMQAVELVLRGVVGMVQTDGCIGKLSDGYIEVYGTRQSLFSLPTSLTGPVRIDLSFANGSALEAEGQVLEISRHG